MHYASPNAYYGTPPMGSPAYAAPARPSTAHKIILGIVWLTIALGALVFTEPAPTDLLMMGLVALLPVVGLTTFTPAVMGLLFAWLIIAAGGLIAANFAADLHQATVHTVVTLYLSAASVVFTAFVMKNPIKHTKLILHAHVCAALFAVVVGVIGYFDIIPGSSEYLTSYSRIKSTFKDPNVYGPFLIPAILYVLSIWTQRSGITTVFCLGILAVLAVGILLSFSRGAWASLVIAIAIFGYASLISTPSNRQRFKLLAMGGFTFIAGTLVVLIALQFDQISNLMDQRASLSQDYDLGPDGRFGGQLKALDLAMKHPLGIGAGEFVPRYHHEEAHNVYVSMFLNAGWLGGFTYLLVILMTLVFGARHLLRTGPTQQLFIVAYAAFFAHAFEGLIIDSDHWRHYFILIALVWGLMLAPESNTLGRAKSDMPPYSYPPAWSNHTGFVQSSFVQPGSHAAATAYLPAAMGSGFAPSPQHRAAAWTPPVQAHQTRDVEVVHSTPSHPVADAPKPVISRNNPVAGRMQAILQKTATSISIPQSFDATPVQPALSAVTALDTPEQQAAAAQAMAERIQAAQSQAENAGERAATRSRVQLARDTRADVPEFLPQLPDTDNRGFGLISTTQLDEPVVIRARRRQADPNVALRSRRRHASGSAHSVAGHWGQSSARPRRRDAVLGLKTRPPRLAHAPKPAPRCLLIPPTPRRAMH